MRRDTPGPPLLAEPEFCSTAAPSPGGYARASLFGLLASLGGGMLWFMVMHATGRLWGIMGVGLGVGCGLAVHQGAYRLRSKWTGVIGVVCTALGLSLRYYLLVRPDTLSRWVSSRPELSHLPWLDLLFTILALGASYRTAGPIRRATNRLP